MAMALEPKVLLLDEPLAGVSKAESETMVDDARRTCKSRYPMLLVEHDMDAVFTLADRISVLVYGKVIATGTPEAIRADPRSEPPTSARETWSREPAADRGADRRLRTQPGPVRHRPRGRRRRGRDPDGPQRHGQVDDDQVPERDASGERRLDHLRRARRIDAMALLPDRAAGIGLVPEGRQVFPTLTVRENLVATAADRAQGRREPWTLDRVHRLFPRLGSAAAQMAGKLSGGEQQMLVVGRALMTNPKLLVLDEATEGLAPLIRLEIWHCLGR